MTLKPFIILNIELHKRLYLKGFRNFICCFSILGSAYQKNFCNNSFIEKSYKFDKTLCWPTSMSGPLAYSRMNCNQNIRLFYIILLLKLDSKIQIFLCKWHYKRPCVISYCNLKRS